MSKFFVGLALLSAGVLSLKAQDLVPESRKPKKPIICYALQGDQHTLVDAPAHYREMKKNGTARTKAAVFEVEYIGFSPAAQTAFQEAVDIWESLITSPVKIRVRAEWQPLGTGVLGSAIWGSVFRNFQGAQRANTWYPVALAEKIAGKDLNASTDPDIFANFNSEFNWYLGTDGSPSSGQYDFVTVVMHELGHGLGFVDSYSVQGDLGVVGIQDTGFPIIYDQQLENGQDQNLYHDFTNNTAALKFQLTGNNIFYNSPLVLSANSGEPAKIYAPAAFNGGSSISHFDENTYPKGDINSLMSPQVGAVEVIHNPGPMMMGMFSDMGWVSATIDHTALTDTENEDGPYEIKAKITTDATPLSNIKLFYNTGGADNSVTMTPTGVTNEYAAMIPATSVPTTYHYYISVNDALRNYTAPGKLISPAQPTVQMYHEFTAGPDTQAPQVTHSPRKFIVDSEPELIIEAVITDNIGIDEVIVEWWINDDVQPFLTMTEGANSSYSASVSMTGIEIGDKIKYKIVAVDQAAVPNYTNEPASGVHEVNVVGLGPTIDSYANNFDATSGDFFGEGFSMTTPAGFANGAIHTDHPYKQGNGFPNDKLNLTYQLSSPIRVKDEEATIKFDEIVLVEPGEPGSVFGSENFFDYVVVEGSIDGGVTWKPVADGYDSRDNNDWLTLYNSTIVDNSSTGVGNPSLYRTRTMDLLQKFAAGDEVAIRFRLFSDPFARGWGWAIDNLKIQIDETMPTVLNDHVDYIVHGTTTTLPITTKVTDASGVKTLKIEYSVNDGTAEMVDFPVVFNQNEYTLNLGLDNLTAGTKVSYRIVAKDSADNVGIFPPTGYVNVPLIALSSPVSEYVNNFDDPTPDFVGNFFTIEKPSGFSNAAIHSTHFYYNGMGLDKTSDFTFTLKKPITLTSTNHYMQFDEIAIVEGHPQAAVFGTPAFSDYVIVEGSKDGAVTWKKFLDGYDAQEKASWVVAYNNKTSGTSGHYNSRTIDLTASNDFKSGDNVLIRFRMFVDDKNNGWGWSIDNLSIQGPITGVETVSQAEIKLFPNPTAQLITIEMQSMREVPVTIYNQQGVTVYRDVIAGHSTVAHKEINVSEFAEGLYLVKAEVNGKLIVRKFLKVK